MVRLNPFLVLHSIPCITFLAPTNRLYLSFYYHFTVDRTLYEIARNVVEGGYTGRHVNTQTRLTEPQGIIKNIYDAIVIGAGGMGSASAYHLAKSGADVLVLEQFQRGHTLGSSHGATRIIRFFYDKPFYTELMKTAYAEWRDLESVSGKPLLFITGSVCLGGRGNSYGQSVQRSLDAAGVKSEWWAATQLTERFPQFRVSNDIDILWQGGHRFPPRR